MSNNKLRNVPRLPLVDKITNLDGTISPEFKNYMAQIDNYFSTFLGKFQLIALINLFLQSLSFSQPFCV